MIPVQLLFALDSLIDTDEGNKITYNSINDDNDDNKTVKLVKLNGINDDIKTIKWRRQID